MSLLAQNIRFLRKSKSLTQSQLAEKVGLNRSVVAAYEEGRAEPRLQTLLVIAQYFDLSLDELVLKEQSDSTSYSFNSDTPLRILPIAVEKESDQELVTVVPVKAAAGYLDGYGDVDYIGALPKFQLPVNEVPQDETLRLFQVEGDSMLPLQSGSYVLGSFVNDIRNAGGRTPYVIVTEDQGVVLKRVENVISDRGMFRLISDNPEYPPYEIPANSVIEMWKARAFMIFELPSAGSAVSSLKLSEITKSLGRIEKKLFES